MNELDLFRFLQASGIDMRWDDDVLSCWIAHYNIAEFADFISSSLDEGGRDCSLLSNGSIWLDLVPICEYYGIDPERIFPKTELT